MAPPDFWTFRRLIRFGSKKWVEGKYNGDIFGITPLIVYIFDSNAYSVL